MRRSFDGLSAMVRNHMGADPTGGHWFVFVNRRRTLLKVLAFDGDSYWIWAKRLEAGQFAAPGRSADGKRPQDRYRCLLFRLIFIIVLNLVSIRPCEDQSAYLSVQ